MADFASTLTDMINVNSAANAMAGFANLLTYSFIGLMIGGAIILVLWKTKAFHSYPIVADIFEVNNGVTTLVDTDKLRKATNRKTRESFIEFKKRDVKWTPLTFEAYLPMKKGSKVYLKELSHNQFEVIDPKSFISSTPSDYKRFENEEMDRFYKNTQDDAAFYKSLKKSGWERFLDVLPTLSILIAVGIFFWLFGQYVVIPILNQGSAYASVSSVVLDRAVAVMDAQTRYMTVLLQQAGITLPDNFTNITYGNSSVIH